MASGQELQVQEKRELQKTEESTAPARIFIPVTDVYETDQNLTVIMEMPGVAKENVEVSIEDDVLTVDGQIDFSKYETLQPLYSEYNIGNFRRRFDLSSAIDKDQIRAEMKDGVVTLILPKAEQAKPRKITVS